MVDSKIPLQQGSRHSLKKTAELWHVYERLAAVEQEAADLRRLLHETEVELEAVADEADTAMYHLRCLINLVSPLLGANPPQEFVVAAYYLSKQQEVEA